MLLPAPTPGAFYATHLEARQARHDEEQDPAVPAGTWRTLADLLADDAHVLRTGHGLMVAGGDPAPAAANYLMGWVGGALAEAVGFTHATTGAGVLADASVRWRFHPDGWTDRVDVSACGVVVAPDHPWSGLPGVETVADRDAVRARVVRALATTLAPYVTALRGLARIGRNSLWAEVADGLGAATAASPELDGAAGTVPDLQALLDAPGAPWRARPRLWCADAATGPMVVCRKGGCCLAYTTPGADDHVPDLDGLDAEHRAYREAFPRVPGERFYCTTCCFRDASDVEARQVLWADLMTARRLTPTPALIEENR